MRRLPLLLASLVVLAGGFAAQASAADRYALIVSGASRANIGYFETGASTGAYCTDEVPAVASGVTLLVR